MSTRSLLFTGIVIACGALGVVVDSACVIAEPPSDLPTLPPSRPRILREAVVPVPGKVLGRFPSRFIVPVEIDDKRSTIFWSAFVDFNPATNTGLDQTSSSEFEPGASSTQGRVRMIEIPVTTPTSDRCHTIEIVVALQFAAGSAHTPAAPGGDSVSWLFNPSGNLEGCPVLTVPDGGLNPVGDPDGGTEAGTVP